MTCTTWRHSKGTFSGTILTISVPFFFFLGLLAKDRQGTRVFVTTDPQPAHGAHSSHKLEPGLSEIFAEGFVTGGGCSVCYERGPGLGTRLCPYHRFLWHKNTRDWRPGGSSVGAAVLQYREPSAGMIMIAEIPAARERSRGWPASPIRPTSCSRKEK